MPEITNQNLEKEQQENAQTTTTTAAPQQTTQNKRGGLGNTLGGNTQLVGSNQATTAGTKEEPKTEEQKTTTLTNTQPAETQAITKQAPVGEETNTKETATPTTTQTEAPAETQNANVETVAKQDIAVNVSSFKDFLTTFKRALPLGFRVQMTPANWALICPATSPNKEPVKSLLNELATGINQYTNINIFNDKITHLQQLQTKSASVIQQIQATLASTTDAIAKTALTAFLGTVQNFSAQCLEYQQMLQKGYAGVTNAQQYKDKPETLLEDKALVEFINVQGEGFKTALSWATAEGAAQFAKDGNKNPIHFFETKLFPRGVVAEALSKNKTLNANDCTMELEVKNLWDAYKTAKKDATKTGTFQQQLQAAINKAYNTTFLMDKLGGAASPLHEALTTKALF